MLLWQTACRLRIAQQLERRLLQRDHVERQLGGSTFGIVGNEYISGTAFENEAKRKRRHGVRALKLHVDGVARLGAGEDHPAFLVIPGSLPRVPRRAHLAAAIA